MTTQWERIRFCWETAHLLRTCSLLSCVKALWSRLHYLRKRKFLNLCSTCKGVDTKWKCMGVRSARIKNCWDYVIRFSKGPSQAPRKRGPHQQGPFQCHMWMSSLFCLLLHHDFFLFLVCKTRPCGSAGVKRLHRSKGWQSRSDGLVPFQATHDHFGKRLYSSWTSSRHCGFMLSG